MSTKCTVAHDDDFHFYTDCFDDDHVYLEMEKCEFTASQDGVTVRIPLRIWEVIRHYSLARTDLADKSDEQITSMVEVEVRKRVEIWRQHQETHPGKGSLLAAAGAWVYGDVTSPPEQQVAKGVAYYKLERDRQQAMLAAIAGVRNKQRRPAGDQKADE